MTFRTEFYKIFYLIKKYRAYFVYSKKVTFLINKNKSKPIDLHYRNNIKNKFSNYGFKSISHKWHRYYSSIYGQELVEFIPESIFYTTIENTLNNVIMYPALEDKNLLDFFFPKSLLPKTIIKNINGYFYFEDELVSLSDASKKCLQLNEFVIKPTIGTAGGTGVKKIEISSLDTPIEYLKRLFDDYKKDFIIQEVLKQHPDLANLNSTSINTIRVISYLRINDVKILSSVVRIGRLGCFTDNMTLGGIGCGINAKGLLNDFGYDSFGQKFSTSDNGTRLKGFKIPMFKEILENIQEKHKKLPYFKLVSWDFTVTNESLIKMIEYNVIGQDINLHQMANGPLFGEYFNEIMTITKNLKDTNNVVKYER